jgi:hypothetical protein
MLAGVKHPSYLTQSFHAAVIEAKKKARIDLRAFAISLK